MRGQTVEVKCLNKSCGQMFFARVADRKRGWGKYCSKSCKAVHQERRTGQYREYVSRSDEESGGNFIIGAALDGK